MTPPDDAASNVRSKPHKQLHVRIPETIFHRVAQYAQDRGLSVNASIIVLLHEAFDARDADR